jgi:asparagine synthase (glutamine-hydrolysing)
MCGILGQINKTDHINVDLFSQMLQTIHHRGPDGNGVYFDENNQLAFGHTRLSFLDLSDAGKQPLIGNNEQIIVTFNGEIYNYVELKNQLLESYTFITNTDTEVIIAAYLKWGLNFIKELKGMFAIAIYDKKINKVFLIRDRFGIKPLYYFFNEKSLIFASEIKAILASGSVYKEIDFSSFSDYFVYRYVPSPKTIWKNIYKIPPANLLTFDVGTFSHSLFEYWELKSKNEQKKIDLLIDDINKILQLSVSEHTRADVPIGSFLSGGYDSSALVYYMKNLKLNPETFSIGFSDWEKSEDQYAKIVANHLGVNNTSVVANEDSLRLLDIMATVYDEPIADISIVPTYMVSELAAKKVKAVLSGEGADEIFAGYTWQHDFMKQRNTANWFSKLFSKNKPVEDTVMFYAQAMAMGWFDAEELKKMLNPALHQYIPKDVHWFYRSHFNKSLTPLKSIQYLDVKCFMGELVLTKIDRASMANSLEVRVPFLDHTIIEKVFSLNENTYYKPHQTKDLLYQNIKNYLPQSVLNRKKQGFVGPDSYYMNLSIYKKELSDSLLVKHNIINQNYIEDLLNETYNWKLWKILVMEKWYKKWIE